MRYDRTVVAYHGCDLEVADRLLGGEPFRPSENDYDWLGSGIYFWEYGADRAYQFAKRQKTRGKVQTPAVVGAIVQLGRCFDLLDTRFTRDLEGFFPVWVERIQQTGAELPRNKGRAPDWLLRRLDCAVINAYFDLLEEEGEAVETYDTVRCGFVEGPPIYEGAGIHRQSHIQIAVRNQDCILGVFRPTSLQVKRGVSS